MIFSNVEKRLKDKELSFGILKYVGLGEYGRGRKEILLPSEYDILLGWNKDLTIGTTRSGRPRIIKANDPTVYLLLESNGGYTRRGNGRIISIGGEEIATGWGADGDAGRIGQWDAKVLKFSSPGEVLVILSGGRGKIEYIKVFEKDGSLDIIHLRGLKEEVLTYLDVNDISSEILTDDREEDKNY
jgi:hypothetical protein